MAPFSWSRWLRSLFTPRVKPIRRPPRAAVAVESLETRLAPAVFFWTGASGQDANWMTNANWLVSINGQIVQQAPNPDGGDDLVFQGGAAQHSTFNNFTSSSGGTASFNSLKFSDGGINSDGTPYILAGNPIILGNTAQSLSTSLIVNTNVTPSDVQLDVTLAGPANTPFGTQALTHDVNVGSGSVLTISGHLSGSGGKLVKDGFGTLVLTNDNSGGTAAAAPFDDPITIATNGGFLQITNANALGDAPANSSLSPPNTNNTVTVQNNGQLQVNNVTGPIYQPLILNGPGPAADGAVLNLQGTNHWAGPVELDSDSTIGATLGALYIDGVVSDTGNGHNLTKQGDAEVVFTNANTYRGTTTINNGVLDVQNPLALGAADDTADSGTIVNQSIAKAGSLWIEDPTGVGFTVANELLTINGIGPPMLQTLTVSGNSGTFTLTFPPDPFGFNTTVPLPFNASPQQIQNALDALPNVGFPGGFVTVAETNIGSANVYTIEFLGNLAGADQNQLIVNPGAGITASIATLRHGAGGALNNVAGNNTWTGDVIVGSKSPDGKSASIGVAEATTLTVSGFVQSTNGTFNATKVSPGTLILTADNAGVPGHAGFVGNWNVVGGILQIQDSQALGTGRCTVFDGASLALAIDALPDSKTGTTNTLIVSNPLQITGLGASVLGALVNVSGINIYSGSVGFFGNVASIGVLPDPNPSSDTSYFTNDYSLTISGAISGNSALNWFKYGNGQLILPTINPGLHSQADIVQGWVTAQASGTDRNGVPATSLGGQLLDAASFYTPSPPLDQNLQPTVTVESGAALHLYPLNGVGNLDILQNLVLKGLGFSHPFGLINGQGALENIAGFNTVHGNITLEGADGVGVEQIFAASQLQLTGSTSDKSIVFNVAGRSLGGSQEQDNVYDTGSTSGTISLTYNMYGLPDSIDVYYGVKGQPGAVRIFTSNGPISGTATLNLNYTPTGSASFTTIDVVFNAGGSTQANTQWYYTATLAPAVLAAGGITKVGSKLLALQGDGTYSGPVDVRQGVLLDQNNTGLGSGAGTTTVESGAALALANGENNNGATPNANGIAYNNGGIRTGIQVWGEHLILNGPGNTTMGRPLAALDVLSDNTLTSATDAIVPTDDAWRGPITLATNASVSVDLNSRLILSGAIDDTANTLPGGAGSDLLKVGDGEMILVGSNTFRGTTYVGAGSTGDAPVPEIQQVEVYGSSQGTFTLSVTANGITYSTNPLPYGDSPADVQAQLASLLTSAGFTGGTVNVAQTGSFYYLTFGGSLAGNVPIIAAAGSTVSPGIFTLTLDENTLPFLAAGGGATGYYTGTAGQPVDGGVLTAANSQAFGGTANGTIVQSNSSVQVEGNITIAGEPLTIAGSGIPATPGPAPTPPPATWFNQGPAPVNLGPTFGAPDKVSGRVTGIAVDPTDPNTVYLSTAGGGAWKTSNGGKTWQPMFDQAAGSVIPMFSGAIAVDPNNPLHIFLGTGEAHNSTDSYYGTGVYQSFDAGVTWSLMVGETTYGPATPVIDPASGKVIGVIRTPPTFTPTANPFNGLAISSITVAADPNTNQLVVFLAASDRASNSPNVGQGNAGIWRWAVDPADGQLGWFCMTNVTSNVRFNDLTGLTNPGGFPAISPNNPGPDDDWRLHFPTTNGANNGPNTGVWSEVQLAKTFLPNGQLATVTLYAALGDPGPNVNNAVYHCDIPFPSEFGGNQFYATVTSPPLTPVFPNEPADVPIWYVGDENTVPLHNSYSNGGGGEYPTNVATAPFVRNGNIKFWANGFTIFAVNTIPAITNPSLGTPVQALLDIQESTNGGMTWAAIPSPPTNYLGHQGFYDNAVFYNGTTLYVGGELGIYRTANAGGTWTLTSTDNLGNGPAPDVQVFAQGFTNQLNFVGSDLLTGTDGGIWGLDVTTGQPTSGRWFDMNTTLSDTLLNAVSISPSDPTTAYVSSQSAATDKFSNAQGWTMVDNFGTNVTPPGAYQAPPGPANYGQVVRVDPKNPNTVYEWISQIQALPQGVEGPTPPILPWVWFAYLRKSTDGGATWSAPLQTWRSNPTIYLNTGGLVGLTKNPALLIDPVNTSRVMIAGFGSPTGALLESIDAGNSWNSLQSPINPSAVGLAAYQGQFQFDPGFNLVTDVGINSDDPNTIYVTDGTNLAVTKNHGTTWLTRTPSNLSSISDVIVDPNDRDFAYASSSSPSGSGSNRVVKTTNGGRTWISLNGSGTTGLPDAPVWKLTLDPRNGYLYAGTDVGVFLSTDGGSTWGAFGLGLPDVQVKDMVLDQALNTLSIATYGRGEFTIYLNETTATGGALNSVGGTGVWGGPVALAGPTSIGATGIQAPQVGSLAAQLNITGTIRDLSAGANNYLTKVGQGNVILSGKNTYGGTTEVQLGELIVNNPQALGQAGTSEVQTLDLTGLTAGSTYTLTFNGVATNPALTYSGDPTMAAADAAALAAALNALPTVTSQGGIVAVTPTATTGVFTVTFGGNMTGFHQSPLSVQLVVGSGSSAGGTIVTDGAGGTIVDPAAQLGLQSDLAAEPIELFGDGVTFNGHNTGALRGISNFNTFTGKVILESNATIGVDSGSVLNFAAPGTITDNGNHFNLIKESTGTLVLGSTDTFGGGGGTFTIVVPGQPASNNPPITRTFLDGTVVVQGALNVQAGNALGLPGNTTTALNGAQVQLQGGVTVPTTQTLRLSGTGINTTGALEGTGGANHWTGPINLAEDGNFNPPPTTPTPTAPTIPVPLNVGIGSLLTNPVDNLFIDGVIGTTVPFQGITKVDAGIATLTGANTYTGLTTVAAGSLRVENAQALGTPGASSVQYVTVNQAPNGLPQTFVLSFNGANTTGIAIPATALQVANALNALPTVNLGVLGATNASVVLNGNVFIVTFSGPLAAGNLPLMTVSTTNAATATVTSNGTVVQSGAALELNLDPGNNPVTVPTESATLNGVGTSEVQVVTVTGTTGAFFLGFNGQTTKVGLPFNATASQVQTALNLLLGSVPAPFAGGFVTVTRTPVPGTPGFVFTVTFGGKLTGMDVPQMTASGSSSVITTAVTTFRNGGGGALRDVAGSNVWGGPVNLQSNSSIGADPGATLTVSGTVQDLNPATVPGPTLTKIGYGTVVLPGNNSYTGPTAVAQGTLNIQNGGALGGLVSEVQQVNLTGSLTGLFNLVFNNKPSAFVSSNTTGAAFLANVKTALTAVLPVGGTVTLAFVPGNNNSFTVTFGGTLANQNLPQMTGTGINGAKVNVITNRDGSNGTTVTPGGTLQMQGGITVSTESLTLSGTGTSAVQQFSTTGGAFTLTFNGFTASLPAGATQDQVAAALNALQSIGGAGGSVIVAQVSGVNVTPVPGGNAQQVAVVGSADLGFTVTVNGQTTAVLPFGATADQVQTALANLPSIGAGNVAVTAAGTVYTVTFSGPALTGTGGQPAIGGSGVYDVVFGGSFANHVVPTMTGTGFGPVVNVIADAIDPTAQDVAVVGAPGGGFTLTFNFQTTQPIPFGATADQVQTALNALPGIGGANSSVTVTLVNGVYVVSFNGSLAGTVLPPMSGSGQVITTTGGGLGALDSASGVNTWSAANPATNPFLLAADTSLGADTDLGFVTPVPATLNIGQTIATMPGVATTNVTKVGSGIAQLSGTTANTYNGLTTVADGTLQLNKTAGVNAIPGTVQVGDNNPTPPNAISDVLQLLASNQMPATTTVNVLPDGLFDLNGQQQTIGALNMTAGTVSITGAGAQLTLNGNVTATADSFGDPATIQDLGTLALGATPRIFNVAGPSALYADLVVSAPVSGTGGVIKNGAGTLAFTTDNPALTGPTSINQGEVLADGDPSGNTLAAVSINGGTLGGNGSVGPVTATPTGGTLMGGDGLPIPPSILNINTTAASPTAALNSATKFNVVLYGAGNGPNSQVTVTGPSGYVGNVFNINNAFLTGTLDPAIAIGQSFVILTTNNANWTITGKFTEQAGDPGVVFINGEKFTITYEDVNGNAAVSQVTQVVLTRQLDTAVVTVSSSVNPSVYGQGVTFTATVTPEPGTGVLPSSDTVTFQLDNNPLTYTTTLTNNRATFAPMRILGQPLSVNTPFMPFHTITATFNADGHDISFVTTDSGTVNQVVQQASTGITVSSAPANPIPGQTVTVTATVSALPPGAGIPTNTVQFFLDGSAVGGPVTLSNGVASAPLTFPSASLHRVRVSYSGDTNFKPTTTTTDYLINVVKGTPGVVIVGSSTPVPPVFGQTVTLTATLSGPLTPTGTVTFYNGAEIQANILGTGTLSGGTVSITVPAPLAGGGSTLPLGVGTHTINVVYSGDTSFIPVATAAPAPTGGAVVPGQLSYTINPANTQTTLNLSSPTIGFGQSLKFTATVVAVAPGAGIPTNTVTFYDGNPATTGTPIANPTALVNGVAVLTNNSLSIGAHTIYARYNGDPNFATSTSAGVAETVMVAATVTVTSTPSASVFGQAVTLTAAVAALAPATGHPNAPDTVTFYDGNPLTTGTLLGTGPITLDATGKAVLPGISTLSVATHTIYAVFSGDNIYLPNTGTGTLKVSQAGTTTTVTAPATSTYGQGIALTATIAIVSPGVGTLTGTVTFYDGLPANNVKLNAVPAPLSGNVASISNVILAAGQHNIYAVYGNDPNFATSTSTGTGVASIKVNQDHTTTTLSESSAGSAAGSAFYSVPVTLVATVTANFTGNAVPTGSVTFTDNGRSLGAAVALNSSGIATLTVSNLGVGSHTLAATYGTSLNFLTSTSSNVPLSVAPDNTNTAVTSSVNPSFVGQAVTFTAAVTAAISNVVVATGSVGFYDNGHLLGGRMLLANGTATLTTSALAFGHGLNGHSITVVYGTTTNFVTSTGGVTQAVLYNSGIAVTSSAAAPFYGQAVTFTATVSTKTAGASGLFSGLVTFFDGGKQIGSPVSVSGSGSSITALLSTSSLSAPLGAGTHSITASFAQDASSDFIAAGPSAALSQKINQDTTTTAITAPTGSPAFPYQTTYGAALTFTAVVTANVAGVTPTGNVNFYDGSTLLGTGTPLVNGQTTFSYSTLAAGTALHTITAKYVGPDPNFAASPNSPPQSVKVNQAQTTTALTATTGTPPAAASTTVYGQAVTFTATVTPNFPGGGAPVGSVIFTDVTTGTLLGTVNLTASGPNSATATLPISTLAVGGHQIAAIFNGSTNYAGSSTLSNNTNYSLTVTKDATTIGLTASANPAFVNQPVVFTAVVKAAAPGSGTPTGKVGFSLDGGATFFATVALNNQGVATTTKTDQTAETYKVTAVYLPGSDPNFTADPAGVSVSEVVKAQTLAKLVGPTSPITVTVNVFTTFQVTGEDASNNQDFSANGPVKVSILTTTASGGQLMASNGTTGTSLTFNFVNGILMANLAVTKPGTYVLLVDSGLKDSMGNEIETTVTLVVKSRQT